MIDEEFEKQLEHALLKMERLRNHFSEEKLAYAMTYDFYDELKNYLHIPTPQTAGHPYGKIGEHYVGIFNETFPQPSRSIIPVILGKEYDASMLIGDTIVVDDEKRLFSLSSLDPVCFRDTGLTIRFNQIQTPSRISMKFKVPPDIFEILAQMASESGREDKPSEDKSEALDKFLDGFKVKKEAPRKKGEY